MSRRRTAAQIMQEAIAAAKLVSAEDEIDVLWRSMAYQRDQDGYTIGQPEKRKLYQDIEQGRVRMAQAFRERHPEFGNAYDAIFGDPLRIPSYPHFMKLVKIGRDEFLTQPELWGKLPDSFECLYQLSLFQDDVGMLVADGTITEKTSLKAIRRLRRRCDKRAERERECKEAKERHEKEMRAIDGGVRQTVTKELIAAFLSRDETKAEIERRAEKLKEQFLAEHPDLDGFFRSISLNATRRLSPKNKKPTPTFSDCEEDILAHWVHVV